MKLKIASSATLALALLSSLYAKEPKQSTQKQDDFNVSTMNFFKQPGLKILDVADNKEYYQVFFGVFTQHGQQNANVFILKPSHTLIIGNAFDDATGERVITPKEKMLMEEAKTKELERQKVVADKLKSYEQSASFKFGTGEQKFYIFTDPECPYCQRLETLLPNFKDKATFYIYLFPLPMHKEAKLMSAYILNAQDHEKALLDIAKGSKEYAGFKFPNTQIESDTNKTLDYTLKIGQELGVRGTPTIFDANGASINGPDLENILTSSSP